MAQGQFWLFIAPICWWSICDIVTETANTVIRYPNSKNQNWFDENNIEIKTLLRQKKNAHLSREQDRRSSLKKKHFQKLKQECQTKLRELQNIWWQQKVVKLQGYADACDLRNFYMGTKQLFGPVRTSAGSLLAADNTIILTDPQDIFLCWKEHFSTFLNRRFNTVPNPPP